MDGEASVIPVTIVGSRSALRDGQWIPRPGTVSVRIASPIAPPIPSNEEAPVVSVQESPASTETESPVDASGMASVEPGREPVAELDQGSRGASNRGRPDEPGEPGPPGERESSHASDWGRAVKLRDAVRAVILAQCGEPDLGARHDVLDGLRRRKREEGVG